MPPIAMFWLLTISGIFGFAIQMLPTFDGGPLLFLLFGAMLLTVEGRNFNEQEQQLLFQAYSMTFRWSLFILMSVYMFSELSAWFGILPGVTLFLNAHWLALTFSGLCLLLGLAGFQSLKKSPAAVS